MIRLLLPALVGACLVGCVASKPALDYQYYRYDNVKKVAHQVVAEKGLDSGDVVLLVSLNGPEADHPMHVYDDALISGFVRAGVRVVKLSDKAFYDMQKHDTFSDEASLMTALKALRAQGVMKVVAYRWIFANQPGVAVGTELKYEDTLRYPADRAYVKVIDTANGQVVWASLLTAQTGP